MSSDLPLRHLGAGRITDGSGSTCRLRGVVERIAEDGVVLLRLGDGLLVVEVLGPGLPVGSGVELAGVAIDLWPVDL